MRCFYFLWKREKSWPGRVLPESVCQAGGTAGAKARRDGREECVWASARGPRWCSGRGKTRVLVRGSEE